MKVLLAIFSAIAAIIVALNILGGIVGGIWLGFLGQWHSIFVGVGGLIGGSFLLSFALMPGFLLAIPAAKFAERNNNFAAYTFLVFGGVYTFGVLSTWCTAIMWYFVHRSTGGALIPLLLWSYGVAIGTLSYIASKEPEHENSGITVMFAAAAYIAGALWVYFGDPTVLELFILFACILALGMVAMMALGVTKPKSAGGVGGEV